MMVSVSSEHYQVSVFIQLKSMQLALMSTVPFLLNMPYSEKHGQNYFLQSDAIGNLVLASRMSIHSSRTYILWWRERMT